MNKKEAVNSTSDDRTYMLQDIAMNALGLLAAEHPLACVCPTCKVFLAFGDEIKRQRTH